MQTNATGAPGPDSPARRRYQFSVRVPPEMLRAGATRYMWRKLRLRYILGWVGSGLGYAAYSATDLGPLTDALGLITALLVLVLVLLPVVVWLQVKKTVEGYGKLTGGMPVEYEVDDEWFISRYANGAGELRWSAFKKILKTDDVWMLLMDAEDRFIPLPIDQVPEDALVFINAEVADHGG
ncbi:MAG: hypothetical protein GF393_12660 [Armatimonadia bacterium]|nr:hypothetical protein [Armatimonadia bacterium]